MLHGSLVLVAVRLFTNDREFPAVRRVFAGQGFVTSGLMTMTAVTTTLVMVLQRGNTDYDMLALMLAVGTVWGPAAGVCLAVLLWTTGWRRAKDEG